MEASWDNVTAASLMLLSTALAVYFRKSSEQPIKAVSKAPPLKLRLTAGGVGTYVKDNNATIVHLSSRIDDLEEEIGVDEVQTRLKVKKCDSNILNKTVQSTIPKAARLCSNTELSIASLPCHVQSELDCLVQGVHLAVYCFADECYTYRIKPDRPITESEPLPTSVMQWYKDVKDDTELITVNAAPAATAPSDQPSPYLLVVLNEDVQILKVQPSSSPSSSSSVPLSCSYETVTSSPIGGDAFLSLCRLCSLTQSTTTNNTATSTSGSGSSSSSSSGSSDSKCRSMSEALSLAESGNCSGVDMSVQDIYGGDYGGLLVGAMTASSLGKISHMNTSSSSSNETGIGSSIPSVADLAMSLLMTVTLNVGQLAVLTSQLVAYKRSEIYFTGSWLTHTSNNSICSNGDKSGSSITTDSVVCRRLAWAVSIWSGGALSAHFLRSGHDLCTLKAYGAWAATTSTAATTTTAGNVPDSK